MIKATYINHMGDDLTVVNSARVSFGKQSKLECIDMVKGKFILSAKDKKLIQYLAKHNHKSPFNHAFATFHVKAPVFVARQLVKHEYMPWNEISRRYVDSEPEFYVPELWRKRSADKKQGSEGTIEIDQDCREVFDCARLYTRLLGEGVCPEQARMVLPQSMMTEWYWSGSLFAFAKMCGLRLKDDSQYETRLVAEQVEDVMMKLFPASWEALRMYAE